MQRRSIMSGAPAPPRLHYTNCFIANPITFMDNCCQIIALHAVSKIPPFAF